MNIYLPSPTVIPSTLAINVANTTATTIGTAFFYDRHPYSRVRQEIFLSTTPSTAKDMHLSGERVPLTESKILALLPPKKRWAFIAKNHPLEFGFSIIALVFACFVIVHVLWNGIVLLNVALISVALADVANTGATASVFSGISLQWFVALLFSFLLLWCFGMVTWAVKDEKIAFAREHIKQLIGFLAGFGTGKGI